MPGQRHRQGHGEQGDDRPVGRRALVAHGFAEMLAQRVVAADAFAADEDLRRRLHVMALLEVIGFLPGTERVVVDDETFAAQQVLGFEAMGANGLADLHPVDFRRPGHRNRLHRRITMEA